MCERFRTDREADFGTDDVTTETDRDAERTIRRQIADRFPDHAISGEELGREPGGPVEWLVDPLDGTNNFAVGHPTIAVAVTACHDGRPVAAAIREPLLAESLVAAAGHGAYRVVDGTRRGDAGRRVDDATTVDSADAADTTVAADSTDAGDTTTVDGPGSADTGERGETPESGDGETSGDASENDDPPAGVTLEPPFDDGDRLAPTHDRPLARSTVSFVVGVSVVRDEERHATARRVRDRLADRAKRTLETWAPCVDWGHLVRGDTAAVVCFDPDDRERAPGELLAREAGVSVERHGDWLMAAHGGFPALRACLPDGVG